MCMLLKSMEEIDEALHPAVLHESKRRMCHRNRRGAAVVCACS